jgi:tetratricopeptide (TPR) repeat protein
MRRFLVAAGAAVLVGSTFLVQADDKPKDAAKAVPEKAKMPARFDKLVREDIFAGLRGDKEALEKGIKKCNDELAIHPKNPEALVWKGAATMFKAGQLMSDNKMADGMKLFTAAVADMDEAVKLAPDDIGVLIPRATVYIGAGRNSPPAFGKRMLETAQADFEKIYKTREKELGTLDEHSQGELRMGLADIYRLLGKPEKSKEQLEAVVKDMKDTKYAVRAQKWLEAKADAKLVHNCMGCHSSVKAGS